MSSRRAAAVLLVLIAGAGLVGDAVIANSVERPAAARPGAYRSAVGRQFPAPSRAYLVCAADSRC